MTTFRYTMVIVDPSPPPSPPHLLVYVFLQLVAQRLKVKSMESRIEIDEQYNEDMRDTRTLRQKVACN